MDSIVSLVILLLLAANLVGLIILLKRKQPEQTNNEQVFKDEVNSLKTSLTESQVKKLIQDLINMKVLLKTK